MISAPKKNLINSPNAPVKNKSDHPCPAFFTLGIIANKWSVKILYTLIHAEGKPLRFGQIQKALDNITQRELTKHLREFERCGLVSRIAYAQVPPRVEYTITELGLSLRTPMDALSDWATQYGEQIYTNKKQNGE